MSKDDEAPGLLSKVVRFVRNPLTNWSELDEPELDKESKYSKQMLKEMIERKRRNDFVRRREFDHLRKLRRREAMSNPGEAGRPSFFQSSMPSKPDDRAGTLKKIDEIEAQMSMQWWKTKHANDPNAQAQQQQGGEANANSSSQPTTNLPLEALRDAETLPPPGVTSTYAPTEPAMLSGIGSAKLEAAADALLHPTPVSAREATDGEVAVPELADSLPGTPRGPRAYDGTLSGYSSSKIMPAEPTFVHDPELEEAAIRFANADYAGAEAGLVEALKREEGAREGGDETWLTLFDLYRATGQQERFENVAIDYASRFGRSAPLWFSLPDAASTEAEQATHNADLSGIASQGYIWNSPDMLGLQSVAALSAALAKAAEPWKLNWGRIKSIEEPALEPLCKLFTNWCNANVQLRFISPEKLELLLADATPSGDRTISPAWWRLRMEMLRITGRADEFELVALDYCVTYEVSPPSWQAVRCQYLPVTEGGPDLADFPLVEDAMATDDPPSSLNSDFNGPNTVPFNLLDLDSAPTASLVGQVLGDATQSLASLEEGLQGGEILVVDCDRLVRVDFSAAGSVLNWVAARQADECQVVFRDMHRLVAIFFNVIGINEHAKVLTRTD